ncbi:MAG: rhomboid family intramembrane serine protease [Gemmobacter sp.]
MHGRADRGTLAGMTVQGTAQHRPEQPGRGPAPSVGIPPVVAFVAAAVAVPELVLQAADAGLVGTPLWRPLSYHYGAFWAGLLHGWRPNFALQPATMFLTHAFLHAGLAHLAGNVLALLAFGRLCAARLSHSRFLLLCLACVLAGGAGFGILASSPRPMVGASGLVSGLVGAWAVWFAQDHDRLRHRAAVSLLRFVAVTAGVVVLNLLMHLFLAGGMAWEAHLGGFLAGAFLAAAWHGKQTGGPKAARE